jgi:hypothetical protein
MDGTSNSQGEMRNPYKTFVRQPKWKRPFDRLGVCVRVLMKRILLNKFSVHQARDTLQCLTVVSTNEKKAVKFALGGLVFIVLATGPKVYEFKPG